MTALVRQAQRDVTRARREASGAPDKFEMKRRLVKLWKAERRLRALVRAGGR